jgi:hypothetical protein
MFFAYFLGGLDFFELVSGSVLTLLAILPIYLFALLVALSTRLKQVSTLGRIGAIFFIIFFVVSGFISLVAPTSPLSDAFRAASNMIKDILTLNWRAILQFWVFLLFYAQFNLLLFYLCCNVISRETDSRELPIKLLLFTIALSWLAFRTVVVWRWGYTKYEPGFTSIPIFLGLCLTVITLFYNRHTVPPIIKLKYDQVRGPRKWVYNIFQPGIIGTVRTMMLILLALVAAAGMIYPFAMIAAAAGSGTAGTPGMDWLQAVSPALQLPFFLVFPFGFLLTLPSIKHNYALQRTMVAMWWGVSGALTAFIVSWWNMRGQYPSLGGVLEFAALVLSPLSSAFADLKSGSGIYDNGPYIRLATGAVGIILVQRYIARVRKQDRIALQQPAPVSAPRDNPPAAVAG